MSKFDNNLNIKKNEHEELYFKIFINYVDTSNIENISCVFSQKGVTIKTVKPLTIQEDGIYFKLDNTLVKGEYDFYIVGEIDGVVKILLERSAEIV